MSQVFEIPTEDTAEVAETIRQQIGNGAFFMMGAKGLCRTATGGLHWRIGRNGTRANAITVEYSRGRDTYTATILYLAKARAVELETIAGVDMHQIKEWISNFTGLCLSVPTVIDARTGRRMGGG
jgi:hypothetical protein